jgi:hypothetical protein
MDSGFHFPSHEVQGSTPKVGTLVVRDRLTHFDLTLYTDSGDACIVTAAALDIRVVAGELGLALNNLHLTVTAWSAARPQRSIAAIEALRALSNELVDLLFPPKKAKCRAAFIAAMRSCEIVQVDTDDSTFFVPWNLLWLEEAQCWSGEITMFRRSHAIVRKAIANKKFGKPGVSLLAYAEDDQLRSARKSSTAPLSRHEELWAVDRLVGSGIVDTLRDLSPGALSAPDTNLFNQWLARYRHLVHFNSHSKGDAKRRIPSDFRLRRGALADGGHLKGMRSYSTAFLNICRSVVHAVDDDFSLAAALHDRKARAVCGTTHAISDGFATLFVRTLYDQLPRCDFNLFDAVRMTQKKLMKKLHHPMALFYVFEGDPSLIVGEG